MSGYHVSIGPGLLPRIGHGRPIPLAEALDRAAGHRYAVIYRLAEDGKPVPVVAGAGSYEVIHVPSGRRFHRHDIDWHQQLNEWELAYARNRVLLRTHSQTIPGGHHGAAPATSPR
jgi:hypothetical protein